MSNRKEKTYQRMGANETSDEEDDALYSTPRRPNGTAGRKGSVAGDSASQLLQLTAKRSLSSVSVTLANLPLDERNFLVLVEDGSVSAVDRFLEVSPLLLLTSVTSSCQTMRQSCRITPTSMSTAAISMASAHYTGPFATRTLR